MATKNYSQILLLQKAALACICLVILTTVKAQTGEVVVSANGTASSFPLVTEKGIAPIYYSLTDAKVVQIAAETFAKDVQLVTGKELPVSSSAEITGEYVMVAGTIGRSSFIDKLISEHKINVSGINGQWERFHIAVVDNPTLHVKKALIVAGSDRRGTAYGIFHVSRSMGVSPFVWWADVLPYKKKEVFISGTYTSSSPSVKYRGIFINDEDW